MRDKLDQSFALLPRRSEPWIWISKPVESRVEEFICRRSVSTGAQSVKGPAKNKLRRAIMFCSHPSEPMVNECGLSDPSPGNNCHDIDVLVCPGTIQKGDVLLATENVASRNG